MKGKLGPLYTHTTEPLTIIIVRCLFWQMSNNCSVLFFIYKKKPPLTIIYILVLRQITQKKGDTLTIIIVRWRKKPHTHTIYKKRGMYKGFFLLFFISSSVIDVDLVVSQHRFFSKGNTLIVPVPINVRIQLDVR